MISKPVWLALAVIFNATGSATADGVARGALKNTIFPYLCTDQKSGKPEVIFFAARPDGRTYTFLPPGAFATREGSVFTAATPLGTVSVNETSFVFVTDDEVRTGPCVAISDRLDEMVGVIEATSPDAFDKLTASYLAPWSEDLAKAKAEAKAEAEASLAAAKAVATAEIDRIKAAAAAEIQTAKEKAASEAEAEIAKIKAETAAASKKAKSELLAASAVTAESARLRRENDMLKARICLLDQQATFSLCPEVRATAKP